MCHNSQAFYRENHAKVRNFRYTLNLLPLKIMFL